MKYILELSNKSKYTLDEADFQKFTEVSGTGNFVKLKQAIINPSFVVCITPVEGIKEVKGHIDPVRNVFVVETEEAEKIEDGFTKKLN